MYAPLTPSTAPMTPTVPVHPTPLLVRAYTSNRAFHHDARELYARTGYTVSKTSGLADHGYRGYLKRALGFWGLRQEQLVITYQAPTTPWQVKADAR